MRLAALRTAFSKREKGENFGVLAGLNRMIFNYTTEVLTLMKGETGEHWRLLCQQAASEQDPNKFMQLIHEITRLLEEKGTPLRGHEKTKQL